MKSIVSPGAPESGQQYPSIGPAVDLPTTSEPSLGWYPTTSSQLSVSNRPATNCQSANGVTGFPHAMNLNADPMFSPTQSQPSLELYPTTPMRPFPVKLPATKCQLTTGTGTTPHNVN